MIIGSARCDENGKLVNGLAGDQTGKEISTQEYYLHPKGWYLLRPKSVEHAEAIAKAMKDACDNSCCGYDQNQRTTGITQLKKYGSMKAIETNCEFDCSSLIRGCIYEATGKDVGDFYTGNEPDVLEDSGLFEDRVAVTSSTVLCNGDVLVTKKKGHTVAVVSGRSRKGTADKTQSTGGKEYMFKVASLVKGNTGADVKLLQRLLIGHGYPVGDSGVDGVFGDATEKAVKKFQKANNVKVNYAGTVGSKTWKALLGV